MSDRHSSKQALILGPSNNPITLVLKQLCREVGLSVIDVSKSANDEDTFVAELQALENADLVVANAGPYTDIAWCIGYAIARGKAVLSYSRSPVNLMTDQSTFVADSLPALSAAVRAWSETEGTQ